MFFLGVTGQTNEQEYLSLNQFNVDTGKLMNFQFLPEEFYSNQLFLFGETHGSSIPHQADVALFKQLYRKAKVRHYIAEVDPIKAWMLNNYLKDGDEQWLRNVFKSWQEEAAQWASRSNWQKYQQLREFYQTVPRKQKFEIVGVDLIQDYSLVQYYVKELFGSKQTGIELVDKFVSVSDTIKFEHRRILGELARNILSEFETSQVYRKKLGRKSTDFRIFIQNAGYVGKGIYRDSGMFKTFSDIITLKHLTNAKFYGFLGFYHTLQVRYEGRFPFAASIKKNGLVRDQVSLQMMAIDSKVLLPYTQEVKKMMPASFVAQLRKQSPEFPFTERYVPYELSNYKPMMKVNGIEWLKALTNPNSVTLFKINSPGSPFRTNKSLGEVSGFQTLKMTDPQSVTTDAFQYIIFFRNSPAAFPLE